MSPTDVHPDDRALRFARRDRVLAAMEAEDVDVLVMGREANARYVSGVPRLWTAGSRAFEGRSAMDFFRVASFSSSLSHWREIAAVTFERPSIR